MGCCFTSSISTNYNQLQSPHYINEVTPIASPPQQPSVPQLREYSVNLRAERLNNKIYRIFFKDISREFLSILDFKFEYKSNKLLNRPWRTTKSFDCRSCRIWKETNEIFVYVRIPSELNDYLMIVRLSLKFRVNINVLISKKWMKYSDILQIKVLSSLCSSQFNVGSFVKFRPPKRDDFYYGTIEEISSLNSSNKDNELLDLCTIKDHKGNIWRNIPTKVLLQLLANDYIDFCVTERNNADFEILFKSNKLNNDMNDCRNILNQQNMYNIYCVLVDCGIIFSQNIADLSNEDEGYCESGVVSRGRCFAYNVLTMLIDEKNDYNLKVNCLKDCGDYLYTKTLRTTMKYIIDNDDGSQSSGFGCDICRTSMRCYDFMFHCHNTDVLRHDLCILCVYEMMKKHTELTKLLYPLLLAHNSLNVFCIDILVSFIVGKVMKFNSK